MNISSDRQKRPRQWVGPQLPRPLTPSHTNRRRRSFFAVRHRRNNTALSRPKTMLGLSSTRSWKF